MANIQSLIFLFAANCFAGPFPSSVQVPASITFVSGSPLNSSEGPTGGFGDVASNVLAALEFKAQNPQSVVRLLVTSLDKRRSREVPTTNEILTTMIPSLNPSRLYRAQMYKGVEFIFTEPRYAAVAQLQNSVGYEKSPMADLTADDFEHLRKRVPQAQLAVALSSNANPAQILRALAPIALSVGEFQASTHRVSGWIPADAGVPGASAQIILNSGAPSLGFYLIEPKSEQVHQRVLGKLLGVEKTDNILFAYSHENKASQLYIDALAIALKEDRRSFRLFVRNPNKLNLKHLPKNIRVSPANDLPHEVVEALIARAVYSPLLSGDVSQSLGIAYARGDKSLIFEVPPWAQEHIESLKDQLNPGESETYQDFLNAICLDDEEIVAISRSSAEWKQKVARLAAALIDREWNRQLVGTIAERKSGWNLYANLLTVYEILNRMDFSSLANPPIALLNYAVLKPTTAELRKAALDTGGTSESRQFALWLLINQGARMDETLWASATESLVHFKSPYFNPWTLLPKKTPRAKLSRLNSAINQEFLEGRSSHFQFWRAKVSLPAWVIGAEQEEIDYLAAFKKYVARPLRMTKFVKAGRGSIPCSTAAIEPDLILTRLLDIDPELFYSAGAWQSARKPASFLSSQLIKMHNHDKRVPHPLSPSAQQNLLRVIASIDQDWQDRPAGYHWQDSLPEAVEVLRGLPPSKIGFALIERVIRIKSRYGDSKTKACDLAVSYYLSTDGVGKKTLPELIGICLYETAEEHPSYENLLSLLREKLPQDSALWDALVEVMEEEAIAEPWGPEKMATLLASFAGKNVSLLRPLMPHLLHASELNFGGFPREAARLVRSFKADQCLSALLEARSR